MADIMDTAQGTISGDVAQIRSAIYGREVRASIAEAIELLDSSSQDAAQKADTAQTSAAGNADAIAAIQEKMGRITPGFTSRFEPGSTGINYPVYRWMNGETSYDKVTADPSLKGTEIQIGDAIYTYTADELQPGRLDFKEYISGCEVGTVNKYGHNKPCGYSVARKGDAIVRLVLFDEDESAISEDADGDIEQCAILYSKSYGVKGFRTGADTKLYLADLLSRIAALEQKVQQLESK